MASSGSDNLYNIDRGILKKNAFIVLVKTEWNARIVDELEKGCIEVLSQYGIRYKTIVVPGCVEIPFAIKRFWNQSKEHLDIPDAFIALGCVIRGDTPHFEYVCDMVSQGIMHLNLQLPVPSVFGVLTVNNEEQALERIGGRHGHKGNEAAVTAIKMLG